MRLIALVRAISLDERGATAIEYGLILALVFLAMLGAVQAFATQLIGMWNYVSNTSAAAMK